MTIDYDSFQISTVVSKRNSYDLKLRNFHVLILKNLSKSLWFENRRTLPRGKKSSHIN